MLTGRPHQPMNFENANPGPPNDFPSLGALLGRVDRARGGLPPSVTLPHRIFNTDGSIWPGQDAGFLGRTFDPWLLNSRLTEGYRIQEIDLPAELDAGRLNRRQSLLDNFQRRLEMLDRKSPAGAFDEQKRRAFDLLGSSPARRAFRLKMSPKAIESTMERLRSARVCCWPAAWWKAGSARPGQLVPRPRRASGQSLLGQPYQRIRAAQGGARPADRPGLLCSCRDLERRGLLDETLVVCMAEFGRSPRLDGNGGRNHWGSVVLGRARRRRCPGRPDLRFFRPHRRLPRRGTGASRGPVGDHLPLPGPCPRNRVPRSARPAPADEPR